MKPKKSSVYKLYDSYTSREYYFSDRKKARLFGEKMLDADSCDCGLNSCSDADSFNSRFELYKVNVRQ